MKERKRLYIQSHTNKKKCTEKKHEGDQIECP